MFFRLLLLLGLLLPLPAAAEALDGDWNGTLAIPGRASLHMLLRFRHDGGKLQARFVSVDQAGVSYPADVKLDGQHLVVTMPFGAIYDGTIAADGKSIAGIFTQHVPLPLTFVPGSVAGVHQPEPGDLTIQTPTGALAGTFLHRGRIGVVIINGSGNANRDGESPANPVGGTYRLLADGLAAHNISSLRTDKRGVGESASAAGPENSLRVEMYADDTRSWAAELKRRLGARCVWLAGHSEGALIAEMAAQDNHDICGIVLLAGMGRKLGIVLHEQLERTLPDEQKPRAFAILAFLDAGQAVTDVPPPLMGLFRPSLQPYMMDEMAQDAAALLARMKIPVLILQGDADVQVSVADAQALAHARPDATLKILPGVNHRQRLEKDGPGAALAPGLVDSIADFVHQHSP